MTDRPIIFSGPMVRALLEGRKTQTRRVLKPQPEDVDGAGRWYRMPGGGTSLNCHDLPYAPGDRLWSREAWRAELTWQSLKPSEITNDAALFYEADGARRDNGLGAKFPGRLRPSIFMPRWASRLTLTVTDVRVQRLQEISEQDARAEGAAEDYSGRPYWSGFAILWNSLHGPDAWGANPWVCALTFNVEGRNIDALAGQGGDD